MTSNQISPVVKTYYQTLQVEADSPTKSIDLSYRRLAKKYHPDCNPSDLAISKMQSLNEAYSVLRDSEKRRFYDLELDIQTARPRSVYQFGDTYQNTAFAFCLVALSVLLFRFVNPSTYSIANPSAALNAVFPTGNILEGAVSDEAVLEGAVIEETVLDKVTDPLVNLEENLGSAPAIIERDSLTLTESVLRGEVSELGNADAEVLIDRPASRKVSRVGDFAGHIASFPEKISSNVFSSKSVDVSKTTDVSKSADVSKNAEELEKTPDEKELTVAALESRKLSLVSVYAKSSLLGAIAKQPKDEQSKDKQSEDEQSKDEPTAALIVVASTPIPPAPTLLPTATLYPTVTPYPTAVPTAVPPVTSPPVQPTAQPYVAPQPASVQMVISQPQSQPQMFHLISPIDGINGRKRQTFEWSTNLVLAPNQRFELIFWRSEQDPIVNGFGLAAPTTESSLSVNLDKLDITLGPLLDWGHYRWGILLVETEPYRRITLLGTNGVPETRAFLFTNYKNGDNQPAAAQSSP